jgi:hypothetical protein
MFLKKMQGKTLMSKKLHIRGFDIDTGKIPLSVIEDKINLLSKKRKRLWTKEFGSENNFLVLLFHLKFVEKLENSQIHNTLGYYKHADNVHHLLYDLGWDFSSDYEENQRLFEDEIKRLKGILEEARLQSADLDKDAITNEKLKLAIEKVREVKGTNYLKLGFNSGEEYARTLYYITYIRDLAPRELIHLFGFPSVHMANNHLSELGLNKSRKKGIEGKIQRKSQDYGKSGRAAQITQRKAQYENLSPTSSNNEEYFRRQISDFIYKYFDPNIFEVIVGVNNRGVIAPLEIDIPIVIYNSLQHRIFRFAVEYNGPRHTLEKDENKQNRLEQKGWEYIEITDIPKYSNNRESLDQKIKETCSHIKTIVDEHSRN